MYQHQAEERPEIAREGQANHGHAADELTEAKKLFRSEITVRKLVAKKHADDGSDREGIKNHGLLTGRKTEAGKIAEDQRQPRTPDEKFQHHHEKQFEADSFIHWAQTTDSPKKFKAQSATGKVKRGKFDLVVLIICTTL